MQCSLSLAPPRQRPVPNRTNRGAGRFFDWRPIFQIPSGRLSITLSPCLPRGVRVRRRPTRVLSGLHFPIPLWEGGRRRVLRRECRGSRSQTKSSFDVRSSQAPTLSVRPHDWSRGSAEVYALAHWKISKIRGFPQDRSGFVLSIWARDRSHFVPFPLSEERCGQYIQAGGFE